MPKIKDSHYAHIVRKKYNLKRYDDPLEARKEAVRALLAYGFSTYEVKVFLGIPQRENIQRNDFVL